MNWKVVAALVLVGLVAWVCLKSAGAQFSPKQSYSDYFKRQVTTYRAPSVNPARTTFDRYFYKNPAVSPYTNLMRPNRTGVPNYQAYVKPELQRRANQRASLPTIGPSAPRVGFQTTTRSRTSQRPSQYFNHYYGGRPGAR